MEKFDKISSKYILKEIFSYIQLNKSLNIIKKSQKLQKVLDISLFTYQNIFLFNKLKINYDTLDYDKLFSFMTDEFKIKIDKNLFIKMIEEKKAKEAIMPINNLSINKNQELKISQIDINWISDINIIKLDLSGVFSNVNEQITIPSGLFHNLKILNVNNNFLTPVSIIIPLIELYITKYNNNNKFLFINDLNKSEINLNNLETLNIHTYSKKNLVNEIKEENCDIIFNIKKIKYLDLHISSNCDNSFIEKYFNLNLSDIIETKPLDKKRKTFLDLINKKEKYFKNISMNNLTHINISYLSQFYQRVFIMETTNNGLRKYCYNVRHIDEDALISHIICLEEKFEEKENVNKILKSYINCKDYDNVSLNSKNINEINFIIIDGHGRKINAEKINAIFDIKKNNYSLQEINLSFVGNGFFGDNYYKNLIKNISKFKVLKKLYLYDHISYEKFKIFLDKISKLKFLEEILIKVDAKLCNNIEELKKLIKMKLPLCKVESYDYCFLRVIQKNQGYLTLSRRLMRKFF